MVTRIDIEQGLTLLIKEVSGAEADAVAQERALTALSLRDDLGIDSLAMVELAGEIEDRYGVTISEDLQDSLATFGDAVDYLQSALRAA